MQFGGTEVDDEPFYYPFIVPTFIGCGVVLSDRFSWHTPFDTFKRIEQKTNNAVEGLETRAVK